MRIPAILLTIALAALSCKKDSVEDRKTVVGLWKMYSTIISSGGPATEQPTSQRSYLEFTTDHKMIFESDNTITTYTYSVTSDSTIDVVTDNNVDTLYRYNLQSNVLTLIPPCTEQCVFKYKAVNSK